MNKRVLVTLAVVLILLAIPVGAYLRMTDQEQQSESVSNARKNRAMNPDKATDLVKKIESKIEQAKLIGATPEQVIAFLERERIGEPPFKYYKDINTNVSKKLGKVSRFINVLVRDVDQVFTPQAVWPIHVTVFFKFNENDRVVAYAVEENTDIPIPR